MALSGTERCRKLRARLRAGRKLMTIEVLDDDALMSKALIAAGQLDPFERDNAETIRRALERVIDAFILEYAE